MTCEPRRASQRSRVPFPRAAAVEAVRRALAEDLGRGGDVTSAAVCPPGREAQAAFVPRQRLILAGGELIDIVGRHIESFCAERFALAACVEDGTPVAAGQTAARVAGGVRAILGGERVALNFLTRLSAIATRTREAVEEVAGTGVEISDTRKTTPGLRALEKYAVAAGGGVPHRAALDERVLVKDNHIALAGGIDAALDALAAAGADLAEAEVEIDELGQLERVLARGVGWILLDNMTPDQVAEAVRRTRGRARLEVSGGLAVGRLRPYAETGVDRLSLGCLTHGPPPVDIGLDVLPGGDGART